MNFVKNKLFCEYVNILNIISKIETPFYLYSKTEITDNFHKFNNAFSKVSHLVCYAVKANSNPEILKILAKLGAGADIVSEGELNYSLKAGFSPKKIVFAGVGKKDDEIKKAIGSDILMFNVESISELYRIDRIAKTVGKVAGISFRVNPDINPNTHSHITTGLLHNKFGLSFSDAFEGYLLARRLRNVNILGVHTHIGSQILNIHSFGLAAKKVSEFIKKLELAKIKLKYIDMGGGLGIKYKDEKPPSPSGYAKEIISALPKNYNLILEPGRFIVGNTGVLISKIIYIKKTNSASAKKNFIIIDAGMNDLVRPAFYGAYHEIIPIIRRNGKKNIWDIAGPVCESSDIFGKDRTLSAVSEGDCLAILCAGAYGYSMASNYNLRPRPAEILVEGNKWQVIRPQEKL